MEPVTPRFEFRAFAQDFTAVTDKIQAHTDLEAPQESFDTYVVSRYVDDHNVKVRDGLLDVKILLQRHNDFEQWHPSLKEAFPLSAELLRKRLFPSLHIIAPKLQRHAYTVAQCFQELFWPNPYLSVAHVHKQRRRFTIDGVLGEVDTLQINGAAIASVAIEGTDIDALVAVQASLGLDVYENVNYVLALKRTMGILPIPAHYWC